MSRPSRLASLAGLYGLRPGLAVGQRVRHRRYGYRGLVVAVDETCRAPEEWYLSNRTRPERDQPWYHVLVHDSANTTYAAQENLAPDPGDEPVEHPLVPRFFTRRVDGEYVRNDVPWPGWEA